jgi:hypothetical protein
MGPGVEWGGIEAHPECAQWATRPLMYMNVQRGETADGILRSGYNACCTVLEYLITTSSGVLS